MTKDRFSTGGGLLQMDRLFDDADGPDPIIGRTLGSYRVEALLAEGGMGRVYRASRIDGSFDRNVAIKLLPPGLGSEYARRFELERRILARLTHANIAQLYDAGVSDHGSLYLVMELVEGEPVDQFARQLDIRQKTRLMVTLTEALAFAHARLVVHRDLKPSNVLITRDGILKLLDFGIAKILESPDSLTVASRPMTPRYASPEQLLNEPVSVASDIYQIGLLFLSLFDLRNPAEDFSLATAMERAVRKVPVTADSVLQDPLPPEVAAILNQCLEAEPDDRYASAAELAADLRNYLGGFPVAARNPGPLERGYKFVRRNWLATSATITAFVVLVAFLLFSLRQQAVTEEARDLAERQRARAAETTQFLVSLFDASKPNESLGKELSAKDILERGLERLRSSDVTPALEAELLQTIGDVYRNLTDYDRALELVKQSLSIKQDLYGDGSLETASSYATLSRLNTALGNLDDAVETGRRSYEVTESQLGPVHDQTLDALGAYGFALQRNEEYAEAERALKGVLDGRRALHGENHTSVTTALNNLAVLFGEQGDYQTALSYSEQVNHWNAIQLPADHPWKAMDLHNYGWTLTLIGRYDEALANLRRSLEMREKTDPDNHLYQGRTKLAIANVLRELGRFDEALALKIEAANLIQQSLDRPGLQISWALRSLAASYIDVGRYRDAEARLNEAATHLDVQGHTESGDVALIRIQDARIHIAEGRYENAIQLLSPIMDGDLFYATHSTAGVLLARAHRLGGILDEARETIDRTLRLIEARSGQSTPVYADAQLERAEIELDSRDPEAARDAVNRHQDFFAPRLPGDHWRLAFGRVLAAEADLSADASDIDIAALSRSVEVLSAKLPEGDARLQRARRTLATASRIGNRPPGRE